MLDQNKKTRDLHLKFSLWVDRINTKRSIGTSPFQLVYGTDVIFPIHLGVPMIKLLQDQEGKLDSSQRRNHQIVEVQQLRDKVLCQHQAYQDKIKAAFEHHAKARDIQVGDFVLNWDASQEDKGKHGKFDNLWLGPFIVTQVVGNNTYHLYNTEDEPQGNTVNGRFLKLFFRH